MSRICMVTGAATKAGASRSHSMRSTKRTFKPNLIKKVLFDPAVGKKKTVLINARVYKKLQTGKKVRIPASLTPSERKTAEFIINYFTVNDL